MAWSRFDHVDQHARPEQQLSNAARFRADGPLILGPALDEVEDGARQASPRETTQVVDGHGPAEAAHARGDDTIAPVRAE